MFVSAWAPRSRAHGCQAVSRAALAPSATHFSHLKLENAALRTNTINMDLGRSVACNAAEVATLEVDVTEAAGDLPSVTLLGIGLMGNKMARRLQEQGFPTTAWNRNGEKSAPLAEAGCTVLETAAAAVNSSEVVVLVLSDAAAIRSTLLEDADTAAALQGKCVVQMGTIGPEESKSIAADVRAAGASYLEAPVLGSQPEAAKGTLLVMVGCDEPPEETSAWPVLKALGVDPLHIGEVGTGAAVKLALNQLIASLTVGFSTSLALLQRNNVDIDKFMAILRPSALYAPTFDKKLQRMLDRDYSNPNFPTKHMLKDVRLFTKEAEGAQLDTALLEGLEKVIASAVDRGLDFTDYSAVHDGVSFPEKKQ